MSEGSATVARRGSRWGPDGVYYPAEEKRTVPLTGAAVRLIFYFYAALRRLLYSRHAEVYVGADQFIYYEPGEVKKRVAPDGYVCFGVPKEPERDVWRTWEEGVAPRLVIEVSSKDSRKEDREVKLPLYRDILRCHEYLIYDEPRDELLLYRRAGEEFALVEP